MARKMYEDIDTLPANSFFLITVEQGIQLMIMPGTISSQADKNPS
jgi:hypothetical protein